MTAVDKRTEAAHDVAAPGDARRELVVTHLKRLLACLAGGVVLAVMWGEQQGSDEDYGLAFHQAVLKPRIVVFLLLGVVAYLAITFGSRTLPYLKRPGAPAFVAGAVTVVAAYTLLKWYDPLGDGKLSTVSDAVDKTNGISFIASWFFGWLWIVGFVVVLVLGIAAIVTRQRAITWAGAAVAAVMAIVAVLAKQQVVDFAHGVDHSLGSFVAFAGFVVMAVSLASSTQTRTQIAATRATLDRVLGRRPGLPLAVLGIVVGLCALTFATWFAPLSRNTNLADTASLFDGTGLQQLSLTYLQWLAYVLFAVTAIAAVAAPLTRIRPIGWVAFALGLVSIVLTLITLDKASGLAADRNVDNATGPWQNLGVGGWAACIAFAFLAGAGYFAATAKRGRDVVPADAPVEDPLADPTELVADHAPAEPTSGGAVADGAVPAASGATSVSEPAHRGRRLRPTTGGVARAGGSPVTRNIAVITVALALFFPPTMTATWQNVLVTQIGVYVLLAVGLNVVVGWAGLLDLGYIAFFALGSYTTAYLVGSLPIKPPSWLEMPPLLAIPFAIVVCLIAGVALGAPTLRLRGDYLAIVTLGFGEIIRLIANNKGEWTGGPSGVRPAVPHPAVHVGPVNITWSQNWLQYWYLLLVILAIVVIAFHRLEGSRIGRAWAAIREDEVAAQATGINTTRVKLLAFAIGASTSGVAGVFFGSAVGYFNPDNFLLVNSILVVAYVVFGGMGSLAGAMAGAAALTWLPEFLRDQVPGPDRQMWIGFVLLLMMIFRPAGLIPAKRRRAELAGLHEDDAPGVRAVPASEGN